MDIKAAFKAVPTARSLDDEQAHEQRRKRRKTSPISSRSRSESRESTPPSEKDDSAISLPKYETSTLSLPEDSLATTPPPDDHPPTSQTNLEAALPAIATDKEAIEEYELSRHSKSVSDKATAAASPYVPGRSSIYVDAFNLALDTVLEEESHLFSPLEQGVFDAWRALPYEAQFLYVRLFLRKTAAWHRVNGLRYHADVARVHDAVAELQTTRHLDMQDGEEEQKEASAWDPLPETILSTTFTFADGSDDHIDTLEEASTLLRLDELKLLAKDARVQGKNKAELVAALRRTSGSQSGLGFATLQRSETEESTRSATSNDESRRENRDAHFVRKILDETGPCVRLSLAPLKLFERVHLVFYRSTEWTENSLTTIILAKIARRNFPEFLVSRSANIFASRALLLEFEAALRMQFRVDSILEFNGTPTKYTLQTVLDISNEIYPRWRELRAEEQEKEDSIYLSGEGAYLRRLSPAWVYTRILHKGADVMGKFKQHKNEHDLLSELLDQSLFHAARRGSWYQRKALLEEHYMHALYPAEGRSEDAEKKKWKLIALQTCEQGLQDPLVHLIYHYDLQKRLMKLEKQLKFAKREQHDFGHVRLAQPVERTFHGIRIERGGSDTPNGNGNKPFNSLNRRRSDDNSTRRSTRTIWLDPASEEDTECTVEEMCLSHYRALGWKGYHSEGGVVRTLFAYLFYDVLFTYVPNVFQTPFQTCPLDLHTDAFYPSRLSEINRRLNEISNGRAPDLLNEVWEQHHERQTCVVGLDWTFEKEDLLEILDCFHPEALATLCRLMAQEYAERGGGIPDLFLWHPDGKKVMFAEVKSENDRLSDTQRLWIHVLTSAGIAVELCHAAAEEVRVVDP